MQAIYVTYLNNIVNYYHKKKRTIKTLLFETHISSRKLLQDYLDDFAWKIFPTITILVYQK
jgi:hypothetical protein